MVHRDEVRAGSREGMVEMMATYTVTAERHGEWWMLTVPEVPGVVSQVKSLAVAEAHVREAIAFVLGVQPESFDVAVVPVLNARISAQIAKARKAVSELAERQRTAAELSRAAVASLEHEGLRGSEIAVVLGVSPQRVSQLSRGR